MSSMMTRAGPADRQQPLHGAQVQANGSIRFRLWAPACQQVRLALESNGTTIDMQAQGGGWHEVESSEATPGTLYRYVLPNGMRVPDPASNFQPDDVHGPSEIVDHGTFAWTDVGWSGRPWHEAVIYELHIGTFTQDGTFRAAAAQIDHLVALGITAIEIMPVADFPGERNWGYDGALLYAPDATYGRPDDFKAFVNAAHAHGLMVFLDVVYNHFGPDGNYLPVYAPAFFTERHKTPWGAAINYDGEDSSPIRAFVIQNALYWINEFHLDGLRLDAVHAIIDDSPTHLLRELTEQVRAAVSDRHIHLVLENEQNQSSLLARGETGIPHLYTAQWNDDVHHVLHVAATGEKEGYYADYLGDAEKLGRALAEGFAFQGERMGYKGEPRGEPTTGLPPTAFITFIQNHDQIGNRAFGDRISEITSTEALRAIAAVYLLLPQVPMLFMGEEWSAAQPFPFFCDFAGELAEAVRKGRREEFAKFPEFQDEAIRARIPDPQAEATFASAKLDWNDFTKPYHAEWLDWYRRLLKARRETIVKLMPQISGNARYELLGDGAVFLQWTFREGGQLSLAANLSANLIKGFPAASGNLVWQEGEVGSDGVFGAWTIRCSVESGYGTAT
jgi:malto-oligosyltrehalose trehalohydrolase